MLFYQRSTDNVCGKTIKCNKSNFIFYIKKLLNNYNNSNNNNNNNITVSTNTVRNCAIQPQYVKKQKKKDKSIRNSIEKGTKNKYIVLVCQ